VYAVTRLERILITVAAFVELARCSDRWCVSPTASSATPDMKGSELVRISFAQNLELDVENLRYRWPRLGDVHAVDFLITSRNQVLNGALDPVNFPIAASSGASM
jgi:hypothetical protein